MGHDFGPRSREVEDLLSRLDDVLGTLIRTLDDTVGREHYVLALAADHGVAPIPEQQPDGGRIAAEDLQQVVENVLVARWGAPASGRYVESVAVGHVYFADGVFARLAKVPADLQAVTQRLRAVPGVLRVLRSDRLSATSSDRAVRAAALGYVPDRSGDLIVLPRPYWVQELRADADATTHGTMYSYDRQVPILLLGGGIRPGRYERRVSPADIAPTLALMAGVPLPTAEGRPLREALR